MFPSVHATTSLRYRLRLSGIRCSNVDKLLMKLYGLERVRHGKIVTCILQCWDFFSIFFMHFTMLGLAPDSISCISFYNIFLCFSYRRLDLKHATGWGMLPRFASPSYLFIYADNPAYFPKAYPALRLGGWTQKTTRCDFYGLPSYQARGLDSTKLLDAAASCEDWRQEKF